MVTSTPRAITPRRADWRRWIAVLAIALVGATSASAIGHGEHDADRDCTVCKLRHDPVADLVAPVLAQRVGAHESVIRAPRTVLQLLGHTPRLPARAPPA